jgi:hypothetical protein
MTIGQTGAGASPRGRDSDRDIPFIRVPQCLLVQQLMADSRGIVPRAPPVTGNNDGCSRSATGQQCENRSYRQL